MKSVDDSCFADNFGYTEDLGDLILLNYIPIFLKSATARMQQYAPSGFTFNTNGKTR